MGVEVIWLVFIIAVIATVFVLWYTTNITNQAIGIVQENISKGVDIFEKFGRESTKGDTISIFVPKVADEPQQVPVKKSENFTQVAEVADKEKIQVCYISDPNGCILTGTSKLINPVTFEPIIPYTYTYNFNIECAEILNGFDYCHTDDINRNGFTTDGGKDSDGNDIGGEFREVWHPYGDDFSTKYDSGGNLVQKGLYDVEVFVRSKKLAETDRYEEMWINYQIELRN